MVATLFTFINKVKVANLITFADSTNKSELPILYFMFKVLKLSQHLEYYRRESIPIVCFAFGISLVPRDL